MAERALDDPTVGPAAVLPGETRPGSAARGWALAAVPGLLCALVALWAALAQPRAVVTVRAGLPASLAVLALALLVVIPGVLWCVRRAAAQRRRTVLRAVEEARREASAARMRFLRRLDHELKNPLTALRVVSAEGADAARAEGQDPSGWLSASSQAVRMSRLVGKLRGLSELEVAPLELEPVRVDALVNEALSDLREGEEGSRLQRRTVRVHLPTAPWPLPAVHADQDLLRLVFHNIIGNAVKYSGDGDTVEITGLEVAGVVVVEVADTGRGIPAAEHELVLEELARGSNATELAGSGVGLALARVIVDRHGGRLVLRSLEGKGTSVRVELPQAPSAAVGASGPRPPRA